MASAGADEINGIPTRGLTKTRRQRILKMVQRQNDDAAYEQVISRLVLMRKIEVANDQIEGGEGTKHDELFRRLEKECHLPH